MRTSDDASRGVASSYCERVQRAIVPISPIVRGTSDEDITLHLSVVDLEHLAGN